jgi:hypothetical protein
LDLLSPDVQPRRPAPTAIAALSHSGYSARSDAACDAAYPDLETRFYRLVERLHARPIRIRVRDRERTVDGDDLHDIVWNALYDIQRIRFLPRMIARLADGDPTVLARVLESWNTGDRIAWGMHYSMDCAERWVSTKLEEVVEAARSLHPAIRNGVIREFTSTFPVCREWNVPPASSLEHTPVHSDIPTLLLSGEFDPGTPSAFADMAAQTLGRSHRVVLPYEGHTDGFVSFCHSSLISAFLDEPALAPATGCIAAMEKSPFVTSGTEPGARREPTSRLPW